MQRRMIYTTTDSIPGREVAEILGVVTEKRQYRPNT